MSVYESLYVYGDSQAMADQLRAAGHKLVEPESDSKFWYRSPDGVEYGMAATNEGLSFMSGNHMWIPLSVFQALAQLGTKAQYFVYGIEMSLLWRGDKLALREALKEQGAWPPK